MHERRLSEIDWHGLTDGRKFHPSPSHWEDEVLYFLLLDRFSDGMEDGYRDLAGNPVAGITPSFTDADNGNAVRTEADAAAWRDAGGTWVGGTIQGLRSKLGYLRRMGITAIWISPVFKQVASANTYHGYGIQNFLEVDPHFGTREELRDLVRDAHEAGIRVILDIILNHSGNVFGYREIDGGRDPRWSGRDFAVEGYRDAAGNAVLPFSPMDPAADPDAAIWPTELQPSNTFTCRGRISNWDYDPEFLEGDFYDLKDIGHGARRMIPHPDDPTRFREEPGKYQPSTALISLCEIYKFWIAYLDLDGYRIDTVKHMDLGATRFFASVIHEFAECLGKDRFYLIGEVTGGRERAFRTRAVTGLDAALGIDDVQDKLEYLVKGYRNPSDYFSLFANTAEVLEAGNQWLRDIVVTQIDDHDQVRKADHKARFSGGPGGSKAMVPASLALNVCTLGIPCVYYGSEQCFDGEGGGDGADRYIREAMFGGSFGAFRSRGRHFFNETGDVYRQLAALLGIRRERAALRRGRQYLREIAGDGVHFGLPIKIGERMRSVVAWSRLYNNDEVIVAINTDDAGSRSAWVTIDNSLHEVGESLTCLYSSAQEQAGQTVPVEARNGRAVRMTLAPAEVAIYG